MSTWISEGTTVLLAILWAGAMMYCWRASWSAIGLQRVAWIIAGLLCNILMLKELGQSVGPSSMLLVIGSTVLMGWILYMVWATANMTVKPVLPRIIKAPPPFDPPAMEMIP